MLQICLVMHVKDLMTMKNMKTYTTVERALIFSLEEEEDKEDYK